jgi:hypothetical protein
LTEYLAPRTAVEEVVASIWGEVFGIPRVGVWDNFFDLGGNSLAAMQIVARVRGMLRVEVSLHQLFDAPTVAAFSLVVVAEELKPGQAERIPEFVRNL